MLSNIDYSQEENLDSINIHFIGIIFDFEVKAAKSVYIFFFNFFIIKISNHDHR